MVKDSRTTVRPAHIRALNPPVAVEVKSDDQGTPMALKIRGRWLNVESLVDQWRIDDEWWREQAISRIYCECLIDQGLQVIIFQNLVTNQWYQQRVE